jgi:murein DD-endopeptidase MepM/ murein hydrolase activator NlpD
MKVATGSNPDGSSATGPEYADDKPSSGTAPANAAKAKPAASSIDLALTPEAQALSNSFAANRGKLPWPVERGTITGYFGLHKHPVANVMIDNNGIDIQTGDAAAVRAVFSGTVSGVFYVPGSGQNVIVQHGDYYTVYANLASVTVRKDQSESTKQTIGVVGNNDDGLPVINFQIWKSAGHGSTKLDPQQWIAR